MPKKSNTKRSDGRIAVQVFIGRENGKRKYKTVYGKTQKEAEKKANELKASISKGLDILRRDDTFDEWKELFLQSVKPTLTEQQYHIYETRLKVFSEKFGKIPIAKIKLVDVQKVINELARENPTTKKPSSKKTLREYSAIVKRVFDYAAANRIIEFNPLSLLTIPKNAPKTIRNAIDDEQIQWIIETPHRAQIAAMIMLFAGLRRGELAALLWSDIDFGEKTITVNKSFDFYENELKSTKTEAGVRTVPIPDILLNFLKEQEKTSIFVFPLLNGKRISEYAIRRIWDSYMNCLNKKYGDFKNIEKLDKKEELPILINTFTMHELRHTYCSMLYSADVDVLTAQYLMGHSDVKTTLNIYTHLSEGKKKIGIEKFNAFLENASQMQVKTPENPCPTAV